MRALRFDRVQLVHSVCRLVQRSAFSLVLAIAVSAGVLRAADTPAPAPAPAAAGQAPASTQPAGKIEVEKANVDFPDTWSGEKVEHTFIVKNTGAGVLEITRVQPGCGCTVAGEFDKKIEPGKTGKIPIALNTQNLRNEVTKQITVESNDPANPRLILTLKGKIRTAIDIQPTTGFAWNQITPQSPETITVTLTNNLESPWKLALKNDAPAPPVPGAPIPPNPADSFDIKIKEVEPGKKAEITAALKKPLREGQNFVQLKFATGLEKQPEVMIAANYYLPPALQVMPNPIYGLIIPGQEFRGVVSVSYNREGDLAVLSATPSDPAIKTTITQPAPNDKKHYTVSVTLPKDYKIDVNNPPKVEITTDKTDLPNKGIVSVLISARPQATQPAMQTPPPDPGQLLVGKPAPELKLKDTDGKEVTVGGKTGSITIIDFWATWCPHCKRQMPVISKVAKDYAAKGVKLVSVSVDGQRPVNPQMSDSDIAAVAKQLGDGAPVTRDPEAGGAFTKYGGGGIPAMFVVNKEGVIEAFHRGSGGPDFEDVLKKELDTLLEGKSLPRPVIAKAPVPAPQLPKTQGPSLAIDSLRQDVGQRKPGEAVQYPITVRNAGTQPVQITSVKSNSGLVTVPAGSYTPTIAPGATSVIRVDLKAPRQPGPFEGSITVESTDPSRPSQNVVLAGGTRKLLEVQPPGGITFSRNPRVQEIPTIATLVYNGDAKLEFGKPESSSPKFEALIEPILNGPHSKLIVKVKPPLAQGEHKGIIRIKTNLKEQPELEVPVSYFMPPRVELSPTEVLLSALPRLQQGVVSIRNNGEKSLNILSIKCSSTKIKTQFFPEVDGLSYRLMVTVPAADPAHGPPAAEKITIRTDDPEYGEIVIPIKFSAAADAHAGHDHP